MEKVSIRRLEDEDLNFAYEIVALERWNVRREDLKRMLAYEPDGCYIAKTKHGPAGHIFSVSYGRLGWVGLLIVRPDCRNKGIATRLMKEAINYLLSRKVETIKLEANPEVANLYRRLGFVDEYDLLRLVGINRKPTFIQDRHMYKMRPDEISWILKFDAKYFGAERTKVLNKLYQEYSNLCFVSYIGTDIVGYIMCRKANFGYIVGPGVCSPQNKKVTKKLLTSCLSRIEQNTKVFLDTPALNKATLEILRKFGFKQYSKNIRMRYGKKLDDYIEGVFAIGGPMKG
nr:GNAT family N-acetyltransferase [Candidatus Njordarchaeota archaeon]